MRTTEVLLVTGAGGRPESRRSTLGLARRLQAHVDVSLTILDWDGHPESDALGAVAPVWSPLELERSPAVGLARRAHAASLASLGKDTLFRRWLRRRATSSVLLDGAAAAPLLPWFDTRRAPIVWLLHPGEELPSEVLHPAPSGERPIDLVSKILVPGAAAANLLAEAGWTGRLQVVGEVRLLDRSPLPDEPAILGIGSPDSAHGLDLVPRLLWQLDRLRSSEPPSSLHWAGVGRLPDGVSFDLQRLGLTDRVELDEADDLQIAVDRARCVVLPWRRPLDAGLVAAIASSGRSTVGFAPGLPAATIDLDAGHSLVPFGDLSAMASAVIAALDDSTSALAAADAGEALVSNIVAALRDRESPTN